MSCLHIQTVVYRTNENLCKESNQSIKCPTKYPRRLTKSRSGN